MCLRRSEFIDYLERLLVDVFHLTTHQRSDFITSLSLSRIIYSEVTFRFLSRDEVQSAVALSISPPPEVSLRLFLIFGQVRTIEARSQGSEARCNIEDMATSIQDHSSPVLDRSSDSDLSEQVNGHRRRQREITGRTQETSLSSDVTRLRVTDWRELVIGPGARSFSVDWEDRSLFRV